MSAEYGETNKEASFKKNDNLNDLKIAENKGNVFKARKFLKASGIQDVLVDFRQGFLGELGEITDEPVPILDEKTGLSKGAGIILEWIEPSELKHLILKINAGYSDQNEKYISASIQEIRHYKVKKHNDDPPLHKISLLPLGRDFSFDDPISKNGKMRYKKWLREKILNYEIIWGMEN